MSKQKTDWAVEAGVGIVIFVVAACAVILFWLALVHVCGVEEPSNVVGFLVMAVVLMRLFAFLTPRRIREKWQRPLREGRGIKPDTEKPINLAEGLVRRGGLKPTPTSPRPDVSPVPLHHSTLTAADALLSIVESTGNHYHPEMTIQDVAGFVRLLAQGYRQTAAKGMGVVSVRSDERTGRDVWRMEVVAPQEAEDAVTFGVCHECGNGASGEACIYCGRGGD